MNQDLVVTFGKSNGKEHNWTYKGLNPNLSTPEIKEACELLTTLDIFEQDGVKLFDSVVTAKVLTHRERLIFDPENDCAPDEPQSNEPNCAEERYFEVSDTSEKTKENLPFNVMNSRTPFIASISNLALDQPRGRHYEQLTQVQPLETTEVSIKVKKDALPPSNKHHQVETIDNGGQKQESDTNRISKAENPNTKKDKGLFQRIFGRRGKNKEDPASNQRE